MTLQPEPARNPNSRMMTDPPFWLRHLLRRWVDGFTTPKARAKSRAMVEAARIKAGEPHRVDCFHQHDDPYSHLAGQVLESFAEHHNPKTSVTIPLAIVFALLITAGLHPAVMVIAALVAPIAGLLRAWRAT